MGKRGPKSSEGKTPIFGFRMRPKLREQLEVAAEANRQTLSEEVTDRLEESFRQDRDIEKQFGSKENYRIMQVLSIAIERAQADSAPSWLDSAETFDFVLQVFNATIEGIRPGHSETAQSAISYRISREIARGVWRQIFEVNPNDPLDRYRRVRTDLMRISSRPTVYRAEFEARMSKRLDELLDGEQLHTAERLSDGPHSIEYLQLRSDLYKKATDEIEAEMKAEGKDPRLEEEDTF